MSKHKQIIPRPYSKAWVPHSFMDGLRCQLFNNTNAGAEVYRTVGIDSDYLKIKMKWFLSISAQD